MVELLNQGIDYLNNNGIVNAIQSNPLASSAIATGAGLVAGVAVGAAVSKRTSKKRKSKSSSSSVRKRNSRSRKKMRGRKLKFGSKAWRKKYLKKGSKKQKKPHTAGKRKDRSTRRIRYTKNNQPYVILPNGRAKFISKKSAHTSKKRRGGKY